MVSVLEQGTPGPPPPPDSLLGGRRSAASPAPKPRTGKGHRPQTSARVSPEAAALASPASTVGGSGRNPPSPLSPPGVAQRSSAAHRASATATARQRALSGTGGDEACAAGVVQRAWRGFLARSDTEARRSRQRAQQGFGAGGFKDLSSGRSSTSFGARLGGLAPGQQQHQQQQQSAAAMGGAVRLTWEDVVLRFCRFIRDHLDDPSADATSVLVLETWLAHLLKARSSVDPLGSSPEEATTQAGSSSVSGSSGGDSLQRLHLMDVFDLSPEDLATFRHKQNELNRLGVTTLLAAVVTARGGGGDGGGGGGGGSLWSGFGSANAGSVLVGGGSGAWSLPEVATELFVELLNGGNARVQQTLYDHLVQRDRESRLLRHVAGQLDRSTEALAEAKRNGWLGSGVAERVNAAGEHCEAVATSCRFLQLLCEGHFAPFQNYLRCQPMHPGGDVNLVTTIAALLALLCDSAFAISRFTPPELALVSQLMNTLVEMMQGPCGGNQELVARSDVVVSVNLVVHASIPADDELAARDPGHRTLRSLGCLLLSACLEGRADRVTHVALAKRLEVRALDGYRVTLDRQVARAWTPKRQPTKG